MTTATVRDAEHAIGRLLIAMTYVSVVLLVIGVGLMVSAAISPLAGGPAFDPGDLLAQVVALDPSAVLWLAILVVIATPITRVVGAALVYAARGDGVMVVVAVGILVVIALGVITAITGTV